jgi:hypothetical protein
MTRETNPITQKIYDFLMARGWVLRDRPKASFMDLFPIKDFEDAPCASVRIMDTAYGWHQTWGLYYTGARHGRGLATLNHDITKFAVFGDTYAEFIVAFLDGDMT